MASLLPTMLDTAMGSLSRDQSPWAAMHHSLPLVTVPRVGKLSVSLGSGIVKGDGKVS